MMEVVSIAAIGGFVGLAMFLANLRHKEKMEDKKRELKIVEKETIIAQSEVRVREKDDDLGNDVLVNRLMELLQIEDWRWTHRREKCRSELFTVVKAMLDNVGKPA